MNVENLNYVALFEKDVQELYDDRVNKIDSYINNFKINFDNTQENLDEIATKTFSYLWNLTPSTFNNPTITKKFVDVLLTPDDALMVLYPGRNSIEMTYFRAKRIEYEFAIPTGQQFTHGAKGLGMRFLGAQGLNSIKIYLYTDKEIDETVGLELQQRRDKILTKIQEVIGRNNEFFSEKIDDFKFLIKEKINTLYQAASERNKINSYL